MRRPATARAHAGGSLAQVKNFKSAHDVAGSAGDGIARISFGNGSVGARARARAPRGRSRGGSPLATARLSSHTLSRGFAPCVAGLGLLPSPEGLKVTECSGVAESANVSLGDIIVELQGEKLPEAITLQEFAEQVAKKSRPIVIGFKKAAQPDAPASSVLFFCACDDSR